MTAQTAAEACELFVSWLDRQVTLEGRGDNLERLDVDPASTFWLGRLASEDHVLASQLGDRAERLDPCAIGLRVRPSGNGPWTFTVCAEARAWVKDPRGVAHPDGPWSRTGLARAGDRGDRPERHPPGLPAVPVLADELTQLGADGLAAEIRIDREVRDGELELVVQLVNTSPDKHPSLSDTHLYETRLLIRDLPTTPFELEALPDSFRYDRLVPAFGINVAVSASDDPVPVLATEDTSTVDTRRPAYWNSPRPQPNLSFAALANDPVGPLTELVDALAEWNAEHWSDAVKNRRAAEQRWSDHMRDEFDRARQDVLREQRRLEEGLALLKADPEVERSFRLMNRAIAYSSEGRGYDSWRPFQVGFLLGSLAYLTAREAEAATVDTVWFATGGGKTETYLGLLVTNAFHDRLTGKTTGVTAWSRFPLRLLSLQQTQRFADALAGAERVRREEDIEGAPFSLGFLVGKGGTPNRVIKDANDDHPDPDSLGDPPVKYQVLLRCPFCHSDDIEMRFDRRYWRLGHQCLNDELPLAGAVPPVLRRGRGGLPVPADRRPRHPRQGRLHRAPGGHARPGRTAAGPLQLRDARVHVRRAVVPSERVPGARLHGEQAAAADASREVRTVAAPAGRAPPPARQPRGGRLALREPPGPPAGDARRPAGQGRRLQRHPERSRPAGRGPVPARRAGLPAAGPTASDSFWTRRTGDALRRFVAVAPRGVTLEHVSDRTTNVLQRSVRKLAGRPGRHLRRGRRGRRPRRHAPRPVRHAGRVRQHAPRGRGGRAVASRPTPTCRSPASSSPGRPTSTTSARSSTGLRTPNPTSPIASTSSRRARCSATASTSRGSTSW